MPFLPVFFAGALFGVLLKWAYDHSTQAPINQPGAATEKDVSNQAATAETPTDIPIVSNQAEEVEQVPPAVDPPVAEPPRQDRLEAIKGIGATTAKQLYQAGIHTYADLAQSTVEQLAQILKPLRSARTADLEGWIAQARALAAPTAKLPTLGI